MEKKKGIRSVFDEISELTYDDLKELNILRDLAEVRISKTEYRIIMAIYKMALNRTIKKGVVDGGMISQYRQIKNKLGYCGCKNCFNEADYDAFISFDKSEYKEKFYTCKEHAIELGME